MELSFDTIDYIFSFLQSDPESLVACSEAHPVLFQIVEKYRYRDILIQAGDSAHNPSHLATLLSHTPRIANYVRVLRIEFRSGWMPLLAELAPILPKLPLLSSIWLIRRGGTGRLLQTALEYFFHSNPRLHQLHIRHMNFPLSTLDNLPDIDCLSISVYYIDIPAVCATTTYPQFKSLWVYIFDDNRRSLFSSWAKHRIHQLESLAYLYSGDPKESMLLNVCSGTLTNLDLLLKTDSSHSYDIAISLSSLARLRHLTIRGGVGFDDVSTSVLQNCCLSFLLAAMKIINTVTNNNNQRAPSLQTLTIEINVIFLGSDVTLDDLDLSPLAALAAVEPFCASLNRIVIYIFSFERNVFTRVDSLLLAAQVSGLKKLIERGMLVVYPEECAPSFL